MNSIDVFSPAKINLFLAITGRRADGFHDLVSVVAPVEFGDRLRLTMTKADAPFELSCDDENVPLDASNLVLRAAEAFRAASGWENGVQFSLGKKIPMGAGLGGGSSNAAAALRGLNTLSGNLLNDARLSEIAAGIGSDCVLFLHSAPVVMRGRGERIEALPEHAARRLRGRRVLIFKPDVSINTAWAYRQLAARAPDSYLAAEKAEERLAAWTNGDTGADELLFNNMEPPAFEKFMALPVLLGQLRERFGVAAGMSGSGSACFALLPEAMSGESVGAMNECVRAAWGEEAFVVEARIL